MCAGVGSMASWHSPLRFQFTKAARPTAKTVSYSFPCTPVPSIWSSARVVNTAKSNSVQHLCEAPLGAEEFRTWKTGQCRAGIETAGLWSWKSVDADSVNLILLVFLVLNWFLNSSFTFLCFLARLSALASIIMDILKQERLERPSAFVPSSVKFK